MNKRGLVRILEASAAIIIIFIAILTISATRKAASERGLSDSITLLLEEIAENNTMREKIIGTDLDAQTQKDETIKIITDFLATKIDIKVIGSDANVCEIEYLCGLTTGVPGDAIGNVYAGSRVISSSLTNVESKRISIFLWFKK